MIKYTAEYIARFDEMVNCDHCGKEMRLGQRIVGFEENLCADCAKSAKAKEPKTANGLIPCDCGNTPELAVLKIANQRSYFFVCKKCGYEQRAYTSKQNAIKAWNRKNKD